MRPTPTNPDSDKIPLDKMFTTIYCESSHSLDNNQAARGQAMRQDRGETDTRRKARRRQPVGAGGFIARTLLVGLLVVTALALATGAPAAATDIPKTPPKLNPGKPPPLTPSAATNTPTPVPTNTPTPVPTNTPTPVPTNTPTPVPHEHPHARPHEHPHARPHEHPHARPTHPHEHPRAYQHAHQHARSQ